MEEAAMSRRRPAQTTARIPDLPQHRHDPPLHRLMEIGDDDPEAIYAHIAHALSHDPHAATRLAAIALDPSYSHYADHDEDDARAWTRVHAVRTLERMGDATQIVIEPLLPLLGTEDDWLREEMPVFYSIVGTPAVPVLTRIVEDKNANLDLRVGAADALVEIAETQPQTRPDTIALLERSLQDDNQDETLLADFVVCLLNLGAKDSYPIIKAAYERDAIDEFTVGLDEVEEHFGLPISPRPQAGESEPDGELFPESSVSLSDEATEITEPPRTPFVAEAKIGRNEPCPCGSGLKYKKCCGK
jgi:hypothetical protein